MSEAGQVEPVILFSTADWAAPYWTNKQHIAARLATRGHPTLYIESPGIRPPQGNIRDLSRIVNRIRRAWTPPKLVAPGLWVFAPLTIPFGHRSRAVKRVNAWLMRRVLRKWLRRHGAPSPILWTYHPYIEGVCDGLAPRATVYHCVDDLAAIPGVDAVAFRQAEQILVERADVVFTTSPYLKTHCETLGARHCIYERNVADIDHFARARCPGPVPPELAVITGPKLCYTGVLSDYKLDLDLLAEAAATSPDLNWIFIGEEPERQRNPKLVALAQLPNVHFLGYRRYDVLPDYLRAIDIAMLPNRTDGYMKGVFPMKFYEYLAAGKPIIATSIEALSDVAGIVRFANDGNAWRRAALNVLEAPPEPIGLMDERLAAHSWERRLDRMLDIIRSQLKAGVSPEFAPLAPRLSSSQNQGRN